MTVFSPRDITPDFATKSTTSPEGNTSSARVPPGVIAFRSAKETDSSPE